MQIIYQKIYSNIIKFITRIKSEAGRVRTAYSGYYHVSH